MIVKICGVTTEDDALLAIAMGADLLGFNFVATSKRQIAINRAADIIKRLPPEIITIGVFKDEMPMRVLDITTRVGLGGVQLHGLESEEDTRWLRERLPVVIKAFPGGDPRVRRAASFAADAILLDAPRGGSGQLFDWGLADQLPQGQRLLLAGGLDPDNVAAAIYQTQPWGVDVASGVEKAPGIKDPVKLRAFIANAKAADPDPDPTLGAGIFARRPPPRRTGRRGDAGGTKEDSGIFDWEELT